ncbi:MAG: response regulator [Rhodanobacteraceae bacterium]|nr:response regulator [Rhodanobacteraceae bacterium]
MARIMIVDDDKLSLKGLQRILAGVDGYEIHAYAAAEEALAAARNIGYDLIIADYLMPHMDGITFLKKLKQLQPDSARIVLSGRCDRQSLYGAINEANALRYIEKPCDAAALRTIVCEVLDDRARRTPPAVQELLGVIRDMETVIQEQAREIVRLQAQLQANSARPEAGAEF